MIRQTGILGLSLLKLTYEMRVKRFNAQVVEQIVGLAPNCGGI